MLRDYEIPLLEEMLQEDKYKNNVPLATSFVKDLLEEYKKLKKLSLKDKKLSADEMFKKLGFYKRVHNNGNIIEWRHKEIHFMISFYKHDKDYAVFGYCYINLEIHKAIHQQCKELGWL